MDEMTSRNIPKNIFTYFVLREAAQLEGDERTAESALMHIRELTSGYRYAGKQEKHHDPALQEHVMSGIIPVPRHLLPMDEHGGVTPHWKGYYASDEDDW